MVIYNYIIVLKSTSISGIIITVVVGIIIVGGVKRVGKVSEKFVPLMASLYVLGCIVIIIPNMIGVLGLSGVIAAKTSEYFTSEEYYLKDIRDYRKKMNKAN